MSEDANSIGAAQLGAGTSGPDGESDGPRLRNPFRSEADAFRLLVIIFVAVAIMVAAAKVGGAPVGIPVAVIVFAIGLRASFRWLRLALAERDVRAGP